VNEKSTHSVHPTITLDRRAGHLAVPYGLYILRSVTVRIRVLEITKKDRVVYVRGAWTREK